MAVTVASSVSPGPLGDQISMPVTDKPPQSETIVIFVFDTFDCVTIAFSQSCTIAR